MTYSNHIPPAQSGPHPQVQPHPHGGLAKLVGSVAESNVKLGKSVWDKVDLAYRQLKNIGDSAGSLFNARATNKSPTPEQVSARAKQSDKILVRVLARQGRYSEIARLAAVTDWEEIVNLAVVRLIDADEDQVQLIEGLARGDSRAAALALFGLLNTGYIDLARQIFVERMADGSLCRMVQNGLNSAFTLLAFAGRLDKKTDLGFCRAYFDPIFASVSGSPRDLVCFLAEILGDPDPLGGRCVPVPSESIPQEIKLMVISLLSACEPLARERCLCYAAADTDEVVARLATTLLIDLWGSPEGCLPSNMQFFAMLNMSFLFHLCNMSASFKWPTAVDFGAYDGEVEKLQQELETLDARYDKLRKKAIELELEGLAKEVDNVVERRLRSLQNLVNNICSLLNLPNPQLEIAQGSFMAAYAIGRGRIKVTSQLFLDDAPLSIDLMSTMLHEIGHMEQDMLVIRLMADDVGLIFGQHSKLLRPLMERYADSIGYAPDPMFLLGILRLRDDRPLSHADRVRAARLIDARYQTENGHHTAKLLETRMEHLEKSQETLLSGSCNRQLLGCLADRRSIESLFKQGQIPAVVLEEIAECQTDFVELMQNYLIQNYADVVFVRPSSARGGPDVMPMASIGGQRYDLIDLARRMLGEVHLEPLQWVVERLKHLLVEVLKEEGKILRSRLNDIRRQGYHEAEAYVISDRAEVTVRALRQGWFRVT
jgi:hypothetical protein